MSDPLLLLSRQLHLAAAPIALGHRHLHIAEINFLFTALTVRVQSHMPLVPLPQKLPGWIAVPSSLPRVPCVPGPLNGDHNEWRKEVKQGSDFVTLDWTLLAYLLCGWFG